MDKHLEQLSLEQEFSHKLFADAVQHLSHQEAQELLVQLHKQMLYKDNLYKVLLLERGKDLVDALFSENNN
jgi:hypothetical protein